MQKILIAGLMVGFIATQIPHTYKVFESFSKLEGRARLIQAWTFAILTSLLIAVFVYIDNLLLASLGAGLEVVINIYYFTQDYWESEFWLNKRKKQPRLVWQHLFMKILFSVLIPVMVLLLSILFHR